MLPIPDQALGTATSTRYAACGRCCLECREGTRRGIPYMDDEMIEKAAMESDTFRQSAKMMSDIQAGRLTAGVDGNSGVVKSEGIEDEMIAGYDGFTKDQFVEGSSGIEPSEIGLNGFVESHPRTQEEVLVYWMQSLPAFRLEMKRSASATHKRNEMPSQLYSTQADDTLDYWRRKLPTNLRSADVLEPPTRAEVAKALAAVHRRKGTSGTGPLLAAQPMQTTPGSLQALQAVQAAAARSPRPAVPAFSPLGPRPHRTSPEIALQGGAPAPKPRMIASTVASVLARPGVVSAQRPPLQSSPRAKWLAVLGAPMGVASSSGLGAPSPTRAGVSKAPGQTLGKPALKRSSPVRGPKGSPVAKARSSPKPAPPRLTAQLLAEHGISAFPVAPPAPGSETDDSLSSAPGDLKHLSPPDRLKAQFPPMKALLGINMVGANTQIQRVLTFHKNRGMDDIADKVKEFQDQVLACVELNLEKLVGHSLDAIQNFITVAMQKGTDHEMQQLPTKNVAELACRQAYALMPPSVADIKWDGIIMYTPSRALANFKIRTRYVDFLQCFSRP